MPKQQQRVTLKMIAEAVGTSIGTVDRALNNRTGISDTKKQQILEVAGRLGYRPNMVASALSRRNSIRIGIAFSGQSSDFYRQIEYGVDQATAEYQDYGVIVERIHYSGSDPQIAYEKLNGLDISKYNGLIINSAGGSVDSFINRCIEAGIPTATFNTDSPETKRLFYVGISTRISGMMGGELMGLFLGGQGNITVLGNFARVSPFIDRFAGFCEFIQPKYPSINFFPCPETKSDASIASQILEDTIKRNPNINGVFCTGYINTVGAAQTLRVLNRKDIALVGYDLSGITARDMQEGWCRALLYQDPRRQGYLAVQCMARYLLEGWRPKTPKIHLESQLIISSNLQSYIEKDNISL